MADLITIAVIALVLGGAIAYIIKEKKRGVRCIGCSMGGCCSGNCSCGNLEDLEKLEIKLKEENCSCGCHADMEKGQQSVSYYGGRA